MQDPRGYSERIFNVLFSERLARCCGPPCRYPAVMQAFFDAGLRGEFYIIGQPIANDRVRVLRKDRVILDEARTDLQRAWARTQLRMAKLARQPGCAEQEFCPPQPMPPIPACTMRRASTSTPNCRALHRQRQASARRGAARAGRHGQVEMAAAFDAAGLPRSTCT